LVKVSPKICIERIKESRFQIELFEKEKKLQETWDNYRKLAKEFDNIKIVNGERKVEEVSYEIINLVEKLIK